MILTAAATDSPDISLTEYTHVTFIIPTISKDKSVL